MCNVQMTSFTETVITSKFIFFNKTIILSLNDFLHRWQRLTPHQTTLSLPAEMSVSWLFPSETLIYSPCSFFSYTVEWTISSKRHLDSPPLFYIATKEQQISFTLDIKVRSELDLNYKIRLKGAGLFLF